MREWKLLCEKALEEDMTSFSITEDVNGDEFSVKELLIIVRLNAATEYQYLIIKVNDMVNGIGYPIINTGAKVAKLHPIIVAGKFMDVGSLAGNNEYNLSAISSYGSVEGINVEEEIRKITFTDTNNKPLLTSGSKYIVYGR